MLGTILLLVVTVCGYLNLSFLVLVPASVLASFIGLHFPQGKADLAKERGMYWKVFFYALPIQAVLLTILFGFGWGINVLIH